MSVIVAVKKNGQQVIGADTAQCGDSLLVRARYVVNHSKILKVGDSYMGMAGWAVAQDILESAVRQHPTLLDLTDRVSIFESMRALHKVLKEEYFISTDEDKDQPVESSQLSALVVSPAGMFEVESYRAVTQCERFWALGSGKILALGAMHALYERTDDVMAIARAGLLAGCEFDDGCAQPLELHPVGSR